MTPFVVAVTATRNRPRELARLLASLEKVKGFEAAVIVDNGGDPETEKVVINARLKTCYFAPGENLGCGGGLALAEKTALEKFPALTHIWILDDDAVVSPDVLEILLREMQREAADIACPMIVDERGQVGWFPGLLDHEKFDAIRQPQTPAEFVAKCGPEPICFSWSTGVSLLVTRRAIDHLGFHRADFWVRGEDLEFSLRITHRRKGIFVPTTTVQHLPPRETPSTADAEMPRHAAMLQNIAYVSIYLPHGHRILHTIPGNLRRFFRTWPARDWPQAAFAFWRGAILGRPAGYNDKNSFRCQFERLHNSKNVNRIIK